MLEEFNQTIIIEQEWNKSENLEVLERGGNQKFSVFMKTWFGEHDQVKFSLLDSEDGDELRHIIKEKYSS